MWQQISPKEYRFARAHQLLKLPCRTTLKNYIGCTNGEIGKYLIFIKYMYGTYIFAKIPSPAAVMFIYLFSYISSGVTTLYKLRMKAEMKSFKGKLPTAPVASLVMDEATIKPKLVYQCQRDHFVGEVNMGPVVQGMEECMLTRSVLCF